MVAISLSGSGEGLGRAIARGYSTGKDAIDTAKVEATTVIPAKAGMIVRTAYTGTPPPSFLRIPVDSDHPFQCKPITDSIPNRSPVPEPTDH